VLSGLGFGPGLFISRAGANSKGCSGNYRRIRRLEADHGLGYKLEMTPAIRTVLLGRSPGSFVRAVLWMLAAMAGFAVMIAIVRILSADLHAFVIAFFRNLFGLLFMVPWLIRVGRAGLKTERLGLHAVRAGFGLAAMLLWFWALGRMPLAEAVALNFTAPLFTTLLSIPLLGEVVRLRRWTATAIGFLGTLVILRPDAEGLSWPALAVIGASLFMALAGISIKKLATTESSSAMVTYMVLFLTPASLLPALATWTTPDGPTWLWLIALGGLATLSHQCLVRAFRLAEASALMPFDYARLPFAAALGFVLFGEIADLWTWVGAAAIAGSGLYIAHREARLGTEVVTPLTTGDSAEDSALRGGER